MHYLHGEGRNLLGKVDIIQKGMSSLLYSKQFDVNRFVGVRVGVRVTVDTRENIQTSNESPAVEGFVLVLSGERNTTSNDSTAHRINSFHHEQ